MNNTQRIASLELGQQTIVDQLAAVAQALVGLQTSILTGSPVEPVFNCWLHDTDTCGPVCGIADAIRALRSSDEDLKNVTVQQWQSIVDAITGPSPVASVDTVEPVETATKTGPKKQATKVEPVISAAFKAVCAESAKQALVNRKALTINDSILKVYTDKGINPFDADGNTDDMRLYLTSAQHRTFKTAWKTAGITLTAAKQALKAACK